MGKFLSPAASKLIQSSSLDATIKALDTLLTFDPTLTFETYTRRVSLVAAIKTLIFSDTLVSYAPLAAGINWDPVGHWGHRKSEFHAMLGDISTISAAGGTGAMASAVIVSNDTGIPGDAFFQLRHQLRGTPLATTWAAKIDQWHGELALLGMSPHPPR